MVAHVNHAPSTANVFGLSVQCPYGGLCTKEPLHRISKLTLAEKWDFVKGLTEDERVAILDVHAACPLVKAAHAEAERRRLQPLVVEEWVAV